MKTDAKVVLQAFLQFLLYSLSALIAMGLLYLDVVILGNSVNEISIVEISQELMLLAIIVMYIFLAKTHMYIRQLCVLLAGFFICMLIRELDVFFDYIQHGFWFYPAIVVAILCIAYTLLKPSATLHQLARYTTDPTYGFMISGLICILVFSRLFGIKYIWLTLLDGNDLRVIKNMVEEGSELFGYTLCFIATLVFYSTIKKDNKP